MSELIVYLEDTPDQSDWVIELLSTKLPNYEIELLVSEKDFETRIDELIARSPSLYLLDMMVNYDPSMRDDSEKRKEDMWLAGNRCARMIRDKGCTAPIIIHSVLKPSEHREMTEKTQDDGVQHLPNLLYFSKEGNIHDLVEKMRERL